MEGLNGFKNIERRKVGMNTLMAAILAFGIGDITGEELIIELKAGLLRAKGGEKKLKYIGEDIGESRVEMLKEMVYSWERALNYIKKDMREVGNKRKKGRREDKMEEMRRKHLEHAKEYFIFQYGSEELGEKIKEKQYNGGRK